jgi:ribonuclease R
MPSPAGTIVTKRSDPTSLRKDILSLLRNNGHKIFRPKEIAKELNIRDNDAYRDFRRVLQEMEDEKAVVRVRRGHITLPRKPSKIRGTLRVNPKGFGFLEVEGETDDLYVRESNMANALDGDIVMAGLAAPTRGDKRREAEILEVIERKRTRVVGTFRKKGHFAFVVPDDVRVTQDVYVPESAFSGASDGDKVVVSIDAFEDRKASPEGRVLEVIGPSSDSRVQVLSLAMSYDVRAGFPDEVVKQAEKIPAKIPASEIDRRLDLREYPIFTIDPADAKDLDDAIHIRTLENGNYEIGVHIADVSHFVESGSALDREAFERATSVYLVDRVMPMLPEKLSNGVCSLNPNEDKLTFSVMVEISTTGAVKNYDIRETIIHSKQRFSYEEAQALLEGKKAESPLAADIQTAGKLAKTLTKRRMKNGAVDFDLPEVKVELDDSGKPIRLYRKQRMDANRLIEEFMLLANRVVARSVRRKKKEMTFIYRVHDRPDPEKIRKLAEYVRAFGYKLPLTAGSVDSHDLNDLLSEVKGKPEEAVIEQAALRSMAKAVYSTKNIGHYGLSFKHYSHFTSPIRRYPDLMAHRLLKRYAEGGGSADQQEHEAWCEHCSDKERSAVEAERESIKLKQVEYIRDHVGDVFDGVISGVTKFGVFIELVDILVEGMVHVRDIDDDFYEYDERTYTLAGRDSGRTFRLGDRVRVQVVSANMETREIDFLFVNDDDEVPAAKRPTRGRRK